MLCFNKLLLAALVFILGAVQINAAALSLPKNGTDYIFGELTETSIHAHTERVISNNTGVLSWEGSFTITRIEALDQTNGTGFLNYIENGINSSRVRMVFDANYPYTENIDYIVRIYGEPLSNFSSNDFILGEQTPNSQLIRTERVTFYNGSGIFSWSGPFSIVKVEALDQSEGLGGFVNHTYGGVNTSSIYLYMVSVFENSTIDFIVNVYVENRPNNTSNNNFIFGNLTENSVFLHTERITGANQTSLNWSNSSYIITRLEGLDQTNGSGGELYYSTGGVGFRFASLYFAALHEGSSIDFVVNIFGEPVTTNDVILGELTNSSILVESRRVNQNQSYEFNVTVPHVISRIEILDQSNGNGGSVLDIIGGLGYRYLYVYFQSENNASAIDFIINVYAEPLTPNHFTFGELTNDSELLHRQRIVEEWNGSYRFYWQDYDYLITKIVALDQSIGDGGEIYYYFVDSNSANLIFTSVFNSSRIDFVIDIYGESLWSADNF